MAAAKKTAAATPSVDETPDPAKQAPVDPPAEETPVEAPAVTLFEYIGEDERTYPDVPITVVPGDIVEWPQGEPGDGRWKEAPQGSAPKRKDNDPEPEDVEEAPAEAEDPTTQEV